MVSDSTPHTGSSGSGRMPSSGPTVKAIAKPPSTERTTSQNSSPPRVSVAALTRVWMAPTNPTKYKKTIRNST